MGVFFSLMVAGLAGSLPHTLSSGLTTQNVPAPAAHTVASLSPVGVLFAAFLGYNPIKQLLGPTILGHLPRANAANLTGRDFFPHLISRPFHDGLAVVFTLAIAMALIAAATSLIHSRTKPTPTADSTSITPRASTAVVASAGSPEDSGLGRAHSSLPAPGTQRKSRPPDRARRREEHF
jgi:hypothetical protein